MDKYELMETMKELLFLPRKELIQLVLTQQEIINRATEYIWSKKYEYGDIEEDNEDFDIDVYELLDILKGEKHDNKK